MENLGTAARAALAVENDPKLGTVARALVGACYIDSVQAAVKRAMLEEALLRTDANYAQAAQMLGVRRQAVQQMVERLNLRDFVDALRKGHAGTRRARRPGSHRSEL